MERMNPIITLTTDFGISEGYVGAMKGVMLSENPNLTLIDITHEIQAYDVMAAAFVLKQSLQYFTAGTVHLVVVDPGVGSQRRGIAIAHDDHYFVGPDNGLFSLFFEPETPKQIVELEPDPNYPLSSTFHGRDLFAPAAAKLASGVPLDQLGSPISRLKPLHWALPIDNEEMIQGWVMYIDHFGNCITNISRALCDNRLEGRQVTGYVGSGIIRDIHTTYSDVSVGDTLMLFGSSDLLEVATNQGDAATLLHIQKGTPINLVFGSRVTSPLFD